MFSRFLSALCVVISATAAPALRVCADPNNLPFSNRRLEGFENRIAAILGRDLGLPVEYTWWAQHRGFVRNTLKAGTCDVILGVPAQYEMTAATKPYYRSTYVFVTRADSGLRIRSLDDPVLRKLRIGVQLIGDDYNNTPPAHALADRGIVQNVSGYRLTGDYALESPPSLIVKAVTNREVDVALVWGPLAGYFAKGSATPLTLAPIPSGGGMRPFTFDIAIGVRHGDTELKNKLDSVLERRKSEIRAVLQEYGVPVVQP